jgi:hypothetical protein
VSDRFRITDAALILLQASGRSNGGGVRKKRTTKITVETERIFVISSRSGEVEGFCDACGEPVRMIPSEKAAVLAGVSLRSICYRIETGKLHFTETAEGLLLICFNSLIEFTAVDENHTNRQVTADTD